MMFRILKHMTVGGEYLFGGSMVVMSVFDHVLDDGRLIYHYQDKFQVLQKDEFKIVYSSAREMEEHTRLLKEKELESKKEGGNDGD